MAEELVDDAPESAPEPSLHDDIASAFEQVEIRDATPAPDKGAPAPAPAGSSGDRARGPDGRYLAQTPETPPRPAERPQDAPGKPGDTQAGKPPLQALQRAPGGPQAQAAQVRAPASWRPQAREHWAKLPPDVQQEVARRETEVGRALQESAQARQALGSVQQVIGPYQQNIAASGSDVLGAISNFFRADNTLRHGSITEKAQIAARIINQYGVDIQTLDSILAGNVAQPDPQAALVDRVRREMQQQLQPVMQHFQQMEGRRGQALQQIQEQAGGEVETFGQDPAHEFFEDVREDMADILDFATQRGQTISLQDAYDRAILMNPQLSEIVAKRKESERASAAAQAAQRARRTAASISSAPAPAGTLGPAGDDRRAAIEAAWADQNS